MTTRAPRILLGIAFVAFVSLGLPDGVLGVAWPSMRRAFDMPLSGLGGLLAAAMAGYLASSFLSGPIVARIGVGRLLAWSSALVAASCWGYALVPAWGLVLACAVLNGLGSGAIDAGINAYAAARFTPRLVNWLHACFGLGAMLGPLIMTAVLAAGRPWRWGYALVGLILAAMAVSFALTRDRWQAGQPAGASARPPAGIRATLARPPVWTSIVFFFVYTGLEATAGQWAYSLLTEGRGIAPAVAGVAAGAYWGSLAAGRLVFGVLTSHLPAETIVRLGMLGAQAGALLVWASPTPLTGMVGLGLLGFSLAPIYPLLISATPARVGPVHAANAIGFQVCASYLGIASIPAAAGLLARARGLEILGPLLFVTAAALLPVHELALRWSRAAARRPTTPPSGPLPAPRDVAT